MGKELEKKCKVIASVLFAMAIVTGKSCLSSTGATFIISGILAVGLLVAAAVAWDMSRMSPADSHSFKSLLVQYVLFKVMVRLGSHVNRKFNRKSMDVGEAQNNLLVEIITRNKNTDYGIQHNFNDIHNRDDFIKKHPLTQYADYQDYVKKICEGQQNILTKDPVVYLSISSGTTGKSKINPVTPHMRGPTAMQVGPLMFYSMNQKMGLNLQRVFILSYKGIVTREKTSNLDKGPITSHMTRYLPYVLCPEEVYDITNERSAIHVHAIIALQETEVGYLEAILSPLVYSFWRYLEGNWRQVCDNIEHAHLPLDLDTDRDILVTLKENIKPNPERANFLRGEFSKGFFGIAQRIWPNLRFAKMLTTGGFANQAKVLREHYMTGVAQLSLVHVASEGFMGFNLSPDPHSVNYTSMITYALLEYIPLQEVEKTTPSTVFAEQVKEGELYEVVMTTPMGLYRYRTGDIIKIVGFTNQCPVYHFQYRLGQTLNLHWEKTPESVLYRAVQQTVDEFTEKILSDFTATEDSYLHEFQGWKLVTKCYVLFVEIEGLDGKSVYLSEEEKQQFDRQLCKSFEMYDMFRRSGSIGRMVVIQVKQGTFQSLRSKMIDKTQNQQFKLPRVLRTKPQLKFLLSQILEKT